MKVSNIRLYLGGESELFYAVGGELLDKEGKKMQPSMVVTKIDYEDGKTSITFSNGHILTYVGIGVSFATMTMYTKTVNRLKKFFKGNEGDTPTDRTSAE